MGRWTIGAVVVVAAALASSDAARAGLGGAVIAGRLLVDWPREGEPPPASIAGATIELVATTWGVNEFPPFDEPVAPAVATATSAADGTFRFDGVPVGRFGLVVRGQRIAMELFSGIATTDGATFRGCDLVCSRKARDYASRIVRKDGGPVGGLEVIAWDARHDGMVFGRRDVVRTKTAADGSFRLSGTTEAPNAAVRIEGTYRLLDTRGTWGNPPESLEVGGAAALVVLATDESGKPVPGARVRVFADGPAEGRTGADGRVEFAGLRERGFMAVADVPGAASPLLVGAPNAGPSSAPTVKPLAAGRNERTVVLEKTCTLTGTVVDRAGGAPVAGARVRFVAASSFAFGSFDASTDAAGRFTLRDLPRGAGVVVVDKDGWRQHDAYADDAWAFVMKAARGEKRDGDPVKGASVFFAAPGAAAEGRFVLDRWAPLAVEIRDTAGKPVGGALVGFLPEGRMSDGFDPELAARWRPNWPESYADDQGRAKSDVGSGASRPYALAPGFEMTRLNFLEIGPARPAEPIVFVLRRRAVADLRIVDGAGRPAAGAWLLVQAKPSDDPSGDAETAALMIDAGKPRPTDAEGKVRDRFTSGTVLVVAGRPGLLGVLVTRVTVKEGGPTTYDVKLAPAGAVAGQVTRGGKPVAGVRVRAFDRGPNAKKTDPEAKHVADVEAAADGSFRIDCVAAGRVSLVAYVANKKDPRRADAQSAAVEIDVKAGPPTALTAPLDIPAPK
jgi:hypothetical protein